MPKTNMPAYMAGPCRFAEIVSASPSGISRCFTYPAGLKMGSGNVRPKATNYNTRPTRQPCLNERLVVHSISTHRTIHDGRFPAHWIVMWLKKGAGWEKSSCSAVLKSARVTSPSETNRSAAPLRDIT